MSAPRRTTVLRAAGAAALVALLAACGSNPAGQAVVVGSASVSDADIATQVEELQAQVAAMPQQDPIDPGAATVAAVDRSTQHLLLEEAAVREGISVSQGQVDTLIANTVDSQFAGDREAFDNAIAAQQSIPASQVEDFARDYLIQSQLATKIAPGGDAQAQSDALVKYLGDLGTELDVHVSPRYGTWDPAKVTLGPVPDDLSVLAGVSADAAQ